MVDVDDSSQFSADLQPKSTGLIWGLATTQRSVYIHQMNHVNSHNDFGHDDSTINAFSALTLLVGQQEGHRPVKILELWDAGMVVCLERDAELHMAQLMPLPLTVSCSSKIQIGFTFWYRLTWVVSEKGPLNVCVCDSTINIIMAIIIIIISWFGVIVVCTSFFC